MICQRKFVDLGLEFGAAPSEPAVYAYFSDSLLFCAAVDVVRGPQITLWGTGRAGSRSANGWAASGPTQAIQNTESRPT